MVHVLLIILKVLGITLLILLGLVLLLVILALAAPFCYSLEGEYYGDPKAVGRVRWLCFVLDFKGVYGNSKFLYYLKSFGFTISTNDEADKHYHKGLDDEAEEETDTAAEDREAMSVPVKLVEDDFDDYMKETQTPAVETGKTQRSQAEPEQKEKQESGILSADAKAAKHEAGEKSENDSSKEPVQRRSLLQKIDDKVRQAVEWITTIPMRIHYKISEILSRILDFLANITENINKLIKKRDDILEKYAEVRQFLGEEETKKALRDCKKYFLKSWRHVRPRRFHGVVHFGMEDPAETGKVLGAVAMLFPVYRDRLVIAPDFEQKILEGEFYARGRIRIGFFMLLGIQMVLNRNLLGRIQKVRNIVGGIKNGK